MSPDLTNRIMTKFPILYGLKDAPLREALMAFGFECDDGWKEIIWALSMKIENWNEEHPETPVQAVQVKEKYGGLRFYVTHEPDEIAELIDNAEKASYKTCEITGEHGRLCRKGGWYKTLCRKEASKNGYVPVSEAE